MAYQGLSPVNKTLSTATQYFSGDGTTRQFTLTQGVSQASDLIVMVGSTLQIPGINYTAASTTITFAVGNAPTAGTNNISVTYIAGNLTTLYITANAYPAGTNVAPSIYTTAAASTGIYWPSTNTLGFTASGNTRVIVSDVANGVATSPSTGALQVNGGLGVTGAHYVGGVLYASSGTASTNQSTGALVVSGGIGASGAMYLGGSLTIAGGNVQPATITGVTRSATFNLFQDGTNKSFSAGNATVHSSNVSVRVISATNAPSLNHWGSAVILDGGFDTDRGYAYTYQAANVVFPAGTSATNTTTTAFAMRLAPSVSNQIPGDLGTRDLVNRAQLILQNMTINFSGPNISSGVGARYLVEGILNPNNVSTTSTTWNFLFNSPYNPTVNPSSSIQPSYTQVAQGNITGVTGSSNISFVGSNTNYAWGGERLFAIPVNYTNSGQLDLSMVKQLGNSGIPGFNTYPDGPELLAINITALVPNTPGSVTGEIQVQWNESQA